jgi:hypothetical protein
LGERWHWERHPGSYKENGFNQECSDAIRGFSLLAVISNIWGLSQESISGNMTKKEFLKEVAREKKDILQEFVGLLKKKGISFCIIGGLGVNAYAEPVVSLDLDVVIVGHRIKELQDVLARKYKVKEHPNSINVSSPFSDLRVQIQIDSRYQDFILRAKSKDVLGYKLPVAAIEDVLQGKIWAAQDESRRPSKRQKDLADILRLVETKKELIKYIPFSLKKKLSL